MRTRGADLAGSVPNRPVTSLKGRSTSDGAYDGRFGEGCSGGGGSTGIRGGAGKPQNDDALDGLVGLRVCWRGSGRPAGGLDYFLHAVFRDHLPGGAPLDTDVYTAMAAAVPAILAAGLAGCGGTPMAVPDFRPGPGRQSHLNPAATGQGTPLAQRLLNH